MLCPKAQVGSWKQGSTFGLMQGSVRKHRDKWQAHFKTKGFLSSSGATSVRTAIEGDRTLGGVAQTTIVRSGSDIRSVTVGDSNFLVVDFDVLVYA